MNLQRAPPATAGRVVLVRDVDGRRLFLVLDITAFERVPLGTWGNCGIGVARFWNLDGTDEFIEVIDLRIERNDIRRCLQRTIPIDLDELPISDTSQRFSSPAENSGRLKATRYSSRILSAAGRGSSMPRRTRSPGRRRYLGRGSRRRRRSFRR